MAKTPPESPPEMADMAASPAVEAVFATFDKVALLEQRQQQLERMLSDALTFAETLKTDLITTRQELSNHG